MCENAIFLWCFLQIPRLEDVKTKLHWGTCQLDTMISELCSFRHMPTGHNDLWAMFPQAHANWTQWSLSLPTGHNDLWAMKSIRNSEFLYETSFDEEKWSFLVQRPSFHFDVGNWTPSQNHNFYHPYISEDKNPSKRTDFRLHPPSLLVKISHVSQV